MVLKIKTSETVKKILDCALTDYNSDISLKNLKNYCYYDVMEEKEKILEKMLERKVSLKQILYKEKIIWYERFLSMKLKKWLTMEFRMDFDLLYI